MNNRAVGTDYEWLAVRELKKKGYKILERNFRCYRSEIDIIAMKDDTIVFVEVKYRHNNDKGNPAEAVDWNKRRRISQAALVYLTNYIKRTDVPCRFDVICILDKEIVHYENAFEFEM